MGERTLKKVLLLAYYFPPLGMGGSQRPAKFAKYLHRYGWEPTVVTVKPIAYWANDPESLAELSHVRIIRTESLDPQRLIARYRSGGIVAAAGASAGPAAWLNQKVLPFFLLPDSKILWKGHAVRAVQKLFQENRFDAVMTTSPPHSVHLIGKRISGKFNLPWIADFRDGWAGGVVVHEPTSIQARINRHLQDKVLRNASAVIAVTKAIASELSNEGGTKVHYLPNGFDPEDIQPIKTGNDRFTICHVGSITRFSHPGTFLKALARLLDSRPELRSRLRIRFVGQDTLGDFNGMVDDYKLNDIVEATGYVSHGESVRYLMDADALLLVAQGNPGAHFIPGKTFEYIGALKPMLVISNVSDTTDLLAGYRLAWIVAPDNIDRIGQGIVKLLENPPEPGDREKRFGDSFDRTKQTEQLAQILDSIT